MSEFRGYRVRSEQVRIGDVLLDMLVPDDDEDLLTDPRVEARFDADEYMPYWADLWPGAFVLADIVASWPPVTAPEQNLGVLEIGAGLGLVGLVAAARGYDVTISDYDEDALAFVVENARRNKLRTPNTITIDWKNSYNCVRPMRIVAADVLYERRNLIPVARFIDRHLAPEGVALVSDPYRVIADDFPAAAREAGLNIDERSAEVALNGTVSPIRARIFQLRRA